MGSGGRVALNWKRTFTLLYLLPSAVWAIWWLYQPWHQRQEDLQQISARGLRLHKSCLDDGLPLETCWRYVEEADREIETLGKSSVFRGYGYRDIVILWPAICFLPPIGGYFLLFVMIPRVFRLARAWLFGAT